MLSSSWIKRLMSLPNIYIVLWCLYFMQGLIFNEGSSTSQILLVILIAISAISYYSLFLKKRIRYPYYIRWTNYFFLFLLMYGTVYFILGKSYVIERSGTVIQSFGFIKQVMISYLPLFTFYNYSRKNRISENDMKMWCFLFLVTAIVFFYVERVNALRLAMEVHSSQTEFTNNSAYFFVAIIPTLIVWRNKPLIQYLLFFICLAFIIVSMKRGAILCGGIAALFFGYNALFHNSKRNKVRILLLSVALLVAAYYLVSQLLINSDLFTERISETLEGNSSSRDVIYSNLIKYILSRDNIFYIVFGEGANATLLHSENYAHNDWLEIAVCEGLVGIYMYIRYWFAFHRSVKSFLNDKTSHFVLLTFLVVFLIRSFFSMSFNDLPVFASVSIGYYMAMAERKALSMNISRINHHKSI